MKDTKIFVGSINTITTQYGEIIALALSPKDKETINQYSNNLGWTNISIMTNIKGQKYAQIDTYSLNKNNVKYASNSDDVKSPSNQVQMEDDIDPDEIPF
jgi:hypothetical protein